MHLDIEAEFYIFTPEVGCILLGTVNKKSVDHIGCLVHKCFHVSVPRSMDETDEKWPGTSVNIGDQVTFTVEACDFTGSLPYIRGKLLNSSPASGTPLVEDEVDSISEPRKKKKKRKHKEPNRSSEVVKCDLMVDSLEQVNKEPVVGPQARKRKRHLEDDNEAAAEKNKKMKKLEGSKTVHSETPESEELHFTRLSSEDVEYSAILQDLKETYLNETHKDLDSSRKKKKKKKKHKSHRDTDENKKTIAEVAKDPEHANECNGDEVIMHFLDHAQKVNKIHKNKNEQEEKLVGEIPDLLAVSGLYKTSAKVEENFITSGSSVFPGSSQQKSQSDIKDLSPKAKKRKLKKHDLHSEELSDVKKKHKTKKRHKEKKSKIKDNKRREHKDKRKIKNAKDHKENKEGEIESSSGILKKIIEKEEKHKEERTKVKDAEGKQEKSKGNDTEDNLNDLKSLASKLFSNFLQQGK
ncbi:hypothetical protein B7P43_G18315 [Cryptotermes secundus]|nr:hypothetical protein B7P43_G18315 [Cryptotermes secundus]